MGMYNDLNLCKDSAEQPEAVVSILRPLAASRSTFIWESPCCYYRTETEYHKNEDPSDSWIVSLF